MKVWTPELPTAETILYVEKGDLETTFTASPDI